MYWQLRGPAEVKERSGRVGTAQRIDRKANQNLWVQKTSGKIWQTLELWLCVQQVHLFFWIWPSEEHLSSFLTTEFSIRSWTMTTLDIRSVQIKIFQRNSCSHFSGRITWWYFLCREQHPVVRVRVSSLWISSIEMRWDSWHYSILSFIFGENFTVGTESPSRDVALFRDFPVTLSLFASVYVSLEPRKGSPKNNSQTFQNYVMKEIPVTIYIYKVDLWH